MKKPEYLTGECKEFLELMKWSFDEHQMPEFDRLVEVTKFYSQPFTKDMIVRPEEPKINEYKVGRLEAPLSTDMIINGNNWTNWDKDYKQRNNWQPLFNASENMAIGSVNGIATIDDFIREAKKAGIKLEWNDR